MRGVILLLALAGALTGCASTQPAKDDALRRFGQTGRAIQPYLKPAADPSVEALYDAFDAAVTEALR